jgi:SAM-dependent methyltransferase/uncharacterized protein YbaR (Trm112 family)
VKRSALSLLGCPACGRALSIAAEQHDGEEIMAGTLACVACKAEWPIAGGVPRFAGAIGDVETRTAEAFGYEWTRYSELASYYRRQFLDWLHPVTSDFFAGKRVLEGGCGKGRHTALAAEFGARDIVSVDLSDAVDAAFANTRHLPNVHIVQADLNHPPVQPIFDFAFSIGVLHHIPDPERGFRALLARVRPGGAISAWVYGREGNGWIVHLISPLRERVTSRMPHGLLDALSGLLTVALFAATRGLYRPLRGTAVGDRLPYAQYLTYIADFPFREQRSIVFDHLVAPIAFYLRRDEFTGWFDRAALVDVNIEHHNANSWRGSGRVPEGATEE